MQCRACELELEKLLCDLPSNWRDQIINVICTYIADQELPCSEIAKCISDEMTTLDYKCLVNTQAEWDALSYNGKIQKIIDRICEAGGLTSITVTDTESIALSGDGSLGNPLSADIIIDPSSLNQSEVTSEGLLTLPSDISDLGKNITQHLVFEAPVMNSATYPNPSGGTLSKTKMILAKLPTNTYANDLSPNNPNVQINWGIDGTIEKSFDNEAGSANSLSHDYGVKAVTNEINIKSYNGDAITSLSVDTQNVVPAGFKALKGGELITTINYSGALLGTSGVWDFKGLYNLTSLTLASIYNETYSNATAGRFFKNTEDLHSLTSFYLFGKVLGKPEIEFTNLSFNTLMLNDSRGWGSFTAKNKVGMDVGLAVGGVDNLNFEDSTFTSFGLSNCGYSFGGWVNTLVMKLTTNFVTANTIAQNSGVFDFSGTKALTIANVNGLLDGKPTLTTPTKLLFPDYSDAGKVKYVDMNQDYIKNEAFISLDNNGLTNGSAFLVKDQNSFSFGENFFNIYYNPTWAPLNGYPATIVVGQLAGAVTSINRNNFGGQRYTTVPVITTSGPGTGLSTTSVMDLAQADAIGLGITSGGTGYTVGDLVTLTGTGSLISPIIQVTSVSAGAVTGYSFTNFGEFTSIPATLTHAGGLVINSSDKFSYKRSIIVSGGTGYNSTSIFKLGVTSGGGTGTGTASTAAKTSIENLHTKGWQLQW